MASSTPAPVDKKELENAQKLWGDFGNAIKISIAAIVFILLLLAAITL